MMVRQQGVALITAVLIVALVTAAAVGLASQQQLDVRRTANIFNNDQAYLVAVMAEEYAREELEYDRDPATDSKEKSSKRDSRDERWAAEIEQPLDDYLVKGAMVDEDAKFNLNNLVDSDGNVVTDQYDLFRRLLTNLGLDPDIAAVAVDWIDTDPGVYGSGAGAEDSYYSSMIPSYQTANSYFASPSELLLLKDVDYATYEQLKEHVTAILPDLKIKPWAATTLNLNTVSKELLQAIHKDITSADAAAIVDERDNTLFDSTADFANDSRIKAHGISVSEIDRFADVKSYYFLVDAKVENEDTRAQLYSLISYKGAKFDVLMRGRGAY